MAQSGSEVKGKLDFSFLEQRIRSWIDSGYYNGASILIGNGRNVLYEQYFGSYNQQTIVFIASAGKWLAAATIAAVVDEGLLSWDDKVKKWLPEFDDQKGEATLAQLLSHTAGYPSYQPGENPVDIYQTLEESVKYIKLIAPDTLAGKQFKYGGLSMQVAGRMAELATGKQWDKLFREKIALPLRMSDTHFVPVDSSGGHAPMLGGGARSTLRDYATFLEMILNRGKYNHQRILSEKAVAFMESDQVKGAFVGRDDLVNKVRADEHKGTYGVGLWREEIDGKGNATLISSPSWAGAYPWIDRKNKLYGFFITHIDRPKQGFNSFLSSPVISFFVREAVERLRHPEVKSAFVPVENGQLFYEETGKGEPLIFIHGHSFDRRQWDPQFYSFSKHFRVIRYDVRGYGRSSMPVEFSPVMHADDLVCLMDKLKIPKAHIVGLSMGGYIGLDFLALHQDRILSVTLASGDVWEGSPGPSVPWSREQIDRRRKEIEQLYASGVHELKRKWFETLSIRNGKKIEHIRERLWKMIYQWDAWQPTHIEPRFLLGSSVVERIRNTKVYVPVLILTGDHEKNRKKQIMQLIPGAQENIIPRAGHVSNLENAAGFNNCLSSFLHSIKRTKDL